MGGWLVVHMPILAAANGWLSPLGHPRAVLHLVLRDRGHDGTNTHLLFAAPLILRLPKETTHVEQLVSSFTIRAVLSQLFC